MNIFEAVLVNNQAEVKAAMARGQTNLQEKGTGFSALHYCAQEGNVELAKILVEGGAEVDSVDKYGNTPLAKAVFYCNGKKEMIKFLLSVGADPDKENNTGVSPRILANRIGTFDVTDCFI